MLSVINVNVVVCFFVKKFEVCKGECIYIIGFNGVGKFMFLFILVGLINFDVGEVFFYNKLMSYWMLVSFFSVCMVLV